MLSSHSFFHTLHALCAALKIRDAAGAVLRAQTADARRKKSAYNDCAYKGAYPQFMWKEGNPLHPTHLCCVSQLGSLLYLLQSQQKALNQYVLFYKGNDFTLQGIKDLKKIPFCYHVLTSQNKVSFNLQLVS